RPRQCYSGACGDGIRGAGGEARDRWGGALRNVGGSVDGAEGNDFEVRGRKRGEIVEIVVVPVIVGGAGDVHGRAVVGHDHAVLLESGENDLVGGGETGNVEAGFEAQAHAHG